MTVQQNVDASEIAKFEAMADRWWDLNGEFKPLHEINPLRLDFINLYSQGIFSKNVLIENLDKINLNKDEFFR